MISYLLMFVKMSIYFNSILLLSYLLLSECYNYSFTTLRELCDISYTNQQYVYALLPVWFLNYNYKGKDYEFAMNGQTGSMFGELPISSSKKNFFKLGIFLIAFIIMMLIGGIFFG